MIIYNKGIRCTPILCKTFFQCELISSARPRIAKDGLTQSTIRKKENERSRHIDLMGNPQGADLIQSERASLMY